MCSFHLALKFHAPNRVSTAGNFGGHAPVSHLLQNIKLPQNFSVNYKLYMGNVMGIVHQTIFLI